MNFLIQEPFVLFLYEFQPETFRASTGNCLTDSYLLLTKPLPA